MDDDRYFQARRRVRAVRGLYIHLIVFVCVSVGLVLIDALTPGGWWFYWPVIAWGIGVAIHAAVVLSNVGIFGQDWEQRKIKEYMDKDQAGH
jgi:hypothetical protein